MDGLKFFFRKTIHYLSCAILTALVFVISLYIFLHIPAFFVVENGEKGPSPLLFLLPLAISVFTAFVSDGLLNKTKLFYNPSFFERKAKAYIDTITTHYCNAQASDTICQFLSDWIVAEKYTYRLDLLSKKIFGTQVQSLMWAKTAMKEFQWKFCDAIDRSADHALSDMNTFYRNNRKNRADIFFNDVRYGVRLYSGDSLKSVSRVLQEVSAGAGMVIPEDLQSLIWSYNELQPLSGNASDTFQSIDAMSGEQFEMWCANLLTQIGFQDVSLTKSSGDQGVDLLACKDGIKYAIQCKCYSSDLGNTPVQEVNTGRVIYGCHIGAVLTNRYFTNGGKEAAAATGVLLWDRSWIQNNLSLLDTNIGRC